MKPVATKPALHKWQVADLLMFDNASSTHLAICA
jgi:hypothetical protein